MICGGAVSSRSHKPSMGCQALGDLLSGGLFLEILPLSSAVLELLESDTPTA